MSIYMQMSFNQWQLSEKGECSEMWLTPKSTRELVLFFILWRRRVGERWEVKHSEGVRGNVRQCEGMCFLSSKLIQNFTVCFISPHAMNQQKSGAKWQKWECRDKEVDALAMFTWTPIITISIRITMPCVNNSIGRLEKPNIRWSD